MATSKDFKRELESYAEATKGSETLAWAKQHKYLSVNSTIIQSSIFGLSEEEAKNTKITLHDIAVKPPKKKKAIPGQEKKNPMTDDAIYASDPEVRKKVPRGLCLLEVSPWHGTSSLELESLIFPAIFAMGKFTGGLGDEDTEESNNTPGEWKDFFLSPVESSQLILRTDKANGEAAHFSCIRLWNGKKVLFCGSKKTHMAISSIEDLSLPCYTTDRFQIARKVAQTVWTLLQRLEDSTRERLLDHLADNFFTATFELLQPDYMHVELLDFEECKLKFIAFTTSSTSSSSSSSLCALPLKAFQMAKEMGLDPVEHETYPYSKLEELMIDIRNGYGKEGSVLYFLDDRGRVIGLLKKKTIWYIILRALGKRARTTVSRVVKLKHQGKLFSDDHYAPNGPPTIKKEVIRLQTMMKKRVKELQNWLGFSDKFGDQWTSLAIDFVSYLGDTLALPEQDPNYRKLAVQFNGCFPRFWVDWLTSTGRTDRLKPFE